MAKAPTGNPVGRPKGSKDLRSRAGSKVLAALGFDPIAVLVRSHDEAEREIRRELAKSKPSGVVIATFLTIKQRAGLELLKYGYAPIPTVETVNDTALPPMSITLTPSGWKPGDPVISAAPVQWQHDPMDGNGPIMIDAEDDSQYPSWDNYTSRPEEAPISDLNHENLKKPKRVIKVIESSSAGEFDPEDSESDDE